jgi:hypothetical protein
MQEWEDLRRRARTLEADIDAKLIAFNRLSVAQVRAGRRPRWAPPLPPLSALASVPPPGLFDADGEKRRRAGGLTAKRTRSCTMANFLPR